MKLEENPKGSRLTKIRIIAFLRDLILYVKNKVDQWLDPNSILKKWSKNYIFLGGLIGYFQSGCFVRILFKILTKRIS